MNSFYASSFVSGDFGGLAHYNGVEWYEYDNVFNPYAVLRSVQVFEDKIFIVGFDGVKAFIYIGSKLRRIKIQTHPHYFK